MTTRPVTESSSNLEARPARTPSPAATELAKTAAAFLLEKQAEEIAILDVSGPLAIVDYFVLATVKNTRQAQAIARELDLEVKHTRGSRKRNGGGLETEDSNWVLLDFDDVVVHLFLPEARRYYGLESLWADAPRLPLPEARKTPEKDQEPQTEAEPRAARHGATQFQVFPQPDADKSED